MLRDRAECLASLGLRGLPSHDEIKKAYHDLVRVWHPDRFMHDPALAATAQEKMKEINEAYNALLRYPEKGTRAETFARAHSSSTDVPVRREERGVSLWTRPLVIYFLILAFSVLMFQTAFSVYRDAFHRASSSRSVRLIA